METEDEADTALVRYGADSQQSAASNGVVDPRGSRKMRAGSHLARCFVGIERYTRKGWEFRF